MKKKALAVLFTVLLGQLFVSPSAARASEKKEEAERVLRAAGERFLDLLDRIDEVYWHFKPSGFRHTIGEEAEHIALTQQGLQKVVLKALQGGDQPEKAKALAGKEEFLRQHMLDPEGSAENFEAPNKLQSKAEVIEYFTTAQRKALELLEKAPNPSLQVYKHPSRTYGELTALQWFYYIAYHCERHVNWIEKMLDHPEFRGDT